MAALDALGADHELYENLRHMFVAQQGKSIAEARSYFITGDAESAILLLHHLSGGAGTLGL